MNLNGSLLLMNSNHPKYKFDKNFLLIINDDGEYLTFIQEKIETINYRIIYTNFHQYVIEHYDIIEPI